MSEPVTYVLAMLGGVALSAVFFGGLWWTVRKGLVSRRPAVWFFVSLLLRLGIVLTGLYWVSGGQLKPLLACLLGFILARPGVLWLTRLTLEKRPSQRKEAGHAP